MPIGPYKDFASCVAAQKKKGKSDESAKKICGSLEQKSKGNITEEELKNEIGKEEYIKLKAEEWLNNND